MKSKTLLPGEWALMMLLVDITEDKTAPARATFQLLPKEEELMLQPRDVLLLATPATGERAEGTLLCSIPSLLQTLSVSYLSPLLPPETTPGVCLLPSPSSWQRGCIAHPFLTLGLTPGAFYTV